jgi:spermidine/putrescine transport system permease protein
MNTATTRSRRLVPLLDLYAAMVYVFLYAPILTMAIFSFHDASVNALPWHGFTLKWYLRALQNMPLRVAFWHSLVLGLAVAIAAVALGTGLALGFRSTFPGKSIVLSLILLPLLTPGIVFGVAMLLVWHTANLIPSLYGSTFIGHVTFVLPYVFLTVFPRIHRFDRSVEEAAMDLGATRTVTFWRITFPLIRPGILAGGVLAFTLSFDEFIRTFFLAGSNVTLPLYLWSIVTNDVSPLPSAVATMIVGFSIGCLILWRCSTGREAKGGES